jgi:hypothetical protein
MFAALRLVDAEFDKSSQQAEMVKAFLVSSEYRSRFGQPVSQDLRDST